MAEDLLSLLCIEPRFPGRLGAVADWLVRKRGYRCQFFCALAEPPAFWPPSAGHGLDVIQFGVGGVARETQVAWNRCLERSLCYSFGCFEVLDVRRPRPVHLVLGRSAGLGSTLFATVALPGTPVVNLFDYYHHPHAHDLTADMPADTPPEYVQWRRAVNAADLLDLETVTAAWVPTHWQRDLFPPAYRDAFTVLFDGVDVRRFRPDRPRPLALAERTLPPDARVITFVARHLDRLRGFDRFWKLVNALMRDDPNVIAVVVGGPIVERGLDVTFFGQDYRAHLLAREPPHDPERVWFLGSVPPSVVADVLTASDLHVYASRPYGVGRSLLEAMAAGRVVLAADHEPVREVLSHGQTGLLADPESEAWLSLGRTALRDPAAHRPLGKAAAALARANFSQDATLPKLARLFDQLVVPLR